MAFLRLLAGLAAITILSCPAFPQSFSVPEGYFCGLDRFLHRTPRGMLRGLPLRHEQCSVAPRGYYCGPDHLLHRTPKGLQQGLELRQESCNQPVRSAKPTYSLATPAQVLAALDCDFAAAARATKGRANDISKAVITGTKGLSLNVTAIPVFAAGSMAPSIDASNLTETTSSDEISISVDPGALTQCKTASADNWLLSKLLFGSGTIHVDKLNPKIEFVVTKDASAGLKLNIVPVFVTLGPQLSSKYVNTQSLSLVFDFKKKSENRTAPEPAIIPAPAASSQSK
jgi:hypothetical protein